MPNSTTPELDRQQANTSYRFHCSAAAFRNVQFCQTATLVRGFDAETDRPAIAAVTCKRWGCPFCARNKIRRLAWLSRNAEPNRLLTLTMDPQYFENPRQCWEKTSPQIPELCKVIRAERGECEYLRITEVHKSGYPHYHLMLRSSFIPQRRISDIWANLTQSPIVDIRKIDSSFKTFNYLCKYLTKLHSLDWTDRHVSYSRKFFREEDMEKVIYAKMTIIATEKIHPFVYLATHHDFEEVEQPRPGYWLVDHHQQTIGSVVARSACGLTNDEPSADQAAAAQHDLPGLEDCRCDTFEDQSF